MSKKKKDAVVRVSADNYARIKEMIDAVHGDEGARPTLNEIVTKLLDTMDKFADATIVYGANSKLFYDLAEARGEAILSAVKDNRPPEWPHILLWVGNDNGGQ